MLQAKNASSYIQLHNDMDNYWELSPVKVKLKLKSQKEVISI